ncbi:CD3073 family putative ECF transporter S component [Loigolactobacillus jiayinensis]|uniref:CD3073 family putative ECF transporter S component n=1 Tax=Loigolactobacillus jiayinensis TaxID=2486016 RepID=A0ABW1RL66_9LACO|nr:CD3073 family putative ECF transporter S component [Loigolactobacillus jiayinensis]
MQIHSRTRIIAYCAIAAVINLVLGEAVGLLHIPLLFLDTLGTIYIAANFGIGWGAMTGFLSNVLMVPFSGIMELPFAIVSIAVAIVVGLFSKGKGFTLSKAIIAGLILAFVAPAIGTPIRLWLYGGFTGSGTDLLIFTLKASGKSMISATFMGTVVGNFVDKILSCVVISVLQTKPRFQTILHRG